MGEKQQFILKPIGDQVAIIRDEIKDKTESGIVLQTGNTIVPGCGTVFAIGQFVEEVCEGDTVYFSAMKQAKEGSTIEIGDQEFLIIQESDLFCTVRKTKNKDNLVHLVEGAPV